MIAWPWIAGLVGLRGLLTLRELQASLRYLSPAVTPTAAGAPDLIILIPALREQARIVATLEHMTASLRGHARWQIYVITTARERERALAGGSTDEVVQAFIARTGSERVRLIHDPRPDGSMASQLNYAVRALRANGALDAPCLLGVYNADSRPDPGTFDSIRALAQDVSLPLVAQQSSVYFQHFDFPGAAGPLHRALLQAFSLLQSRWTLVHEIPRLRRTSGRSSFAPYALAHCVGHGLWISPSILDAVGGFPEATVTEDLFLGYLVRMEGYPIHALPLLESAEAPITVRSTLRQKYIWFWGPMSYPRYYAAVRRMRGAMTAREHLRALILMLQGCVSALAWLSSGWLVAWMLVTAIASTDPARILVSLAAFGVYAPLQYALILRHRRQRGAALALLLSLPAVVLHSIPPLASIARELLRICFGVPVKKGKTGE